MTQNGARIDKEWSQNQKKCAEPPKVATRWLPRSLFSEPPRRFLAIFGSPPGPQNRPKIDPWPQKGRQEAICYRIFSRKAFFSLSGLICHRCLVKIWFKNRCIFSKLRAIFSTWRWPKSMHRRSVLSIFCFVFLFLNLWTNQLKNWQKLVPKKTSKNEARGGPELIQNCSRFFEKLPNIAKKTKQTWKLRGQFFDDFLDGEKTCSGGYSTPRGTNEGPLPGLLGSLGDFRG